MKPMGILLTTPLIMGLAIFVFVLPNTHPEGYNVFQWCLALAGIVPGGLILGALLNFALFAPIYWFLGRLQSRKMDAKTKPGAEA